MPKLSEQQINNIYLRCNAAPIEQLLELCLDPESGITVDGLRAVNYKKIDLLEQQYYAQAEEITWARSQSSIDALTDYIDKCIRGQFTNAHLAQARDLLHTLAAAMEEDDWRKASLSNDLNQLNAFIKKCTEGTFSNVHLQQAKDAAELVEWNQLKDSHNTALVNSFLQKCNLGIYSTQHVDEAKNLIEKWENGTIIEDWNNLNQITDKNERRTQLNIFIQKYVNNPTDTAQKYISKAGELMEKWADEEKARVDWISAKDENSLIGYVKFIEAHPHCEYREEADQRIMHMKGDLLKDMKDHPMEYKREDMYKYIDTKALTWDDLVKYGGVLTDKGYSHIMRYPTLLSEQRQLPLARLENPTSEAGNTDVYFFGVAGSGKTCVLAGLMSLTGQLGFRYDPRGPGGGGNYAMELRNYAKQSMLPPGTDPGYIQVIDCQINNPENGELTKFSLIEMSGEKTALFAAMDTQENFDDLGPGASSLLNNDNNKVLFFVIDPTNQKNVEMGSGSQQWVLQSDVLTCVSSLLSKYTNIMHKVVAIHVILTKSDTLGDYLDPNQVREIMNSQGYQAVFEYIKEICRKYDINKQTGFEVGLFPFHVGNFMPGEVYTFDETDSLKILRVIQGNIKPTVKESDFLEKLKKWFNS